MSEIDSIEAVETINPATGESLDHHEQMSDKEVATAVEKCHEAFKKWKHETADNRAEIIKAIGEGLQKNKTELAKLMTNEMGKLLKQSEQEIDLCSAICAYEAENGPEALKPLERELQNGGSGRISFAPIGVVYGIQPWNYPAYQVVRYAIASLMAGNGVLLKHASNVTGTGKMLGRIFEESGLPKNLFFPLIIDHDQSDDIIKNDLVRGITLTGSPDAGKDIGEKAGKALKKAVLELGSNDAYIVLDDANIEKAVKTCVMGRIYNNGETCIAAKRFIVTEKVYSAFRDGFVKAMSEVKYGDPTNSDNDMGPMAREDLRDELHEQVQESVRKGATIACGGEMPEGSGFYYPATVLENVKPGQPAYDDELFGPVAALIKVKDSEDAMRIANDSRFGLGGGILSEDEDAAVELAEKYFDTGMVFINSFGLADPAMPFGGVKNSGFGREHGGFGLKEFVNVKSVLKRKKK